jgi:hypothetical protein
MGMPHQYEKNNGTPFLLNTIYSEKYTGGKKILTQFLKFKQSGGNISSGGKMVQMPIQPKNVMLYAAFLVSE